jgi:hypothetical protein
VLLVMAAPHRQWSATEYLAQPAALEIAWEFLAPHFAEFDRREAAMRCAADG